MLRSIHRRSVVFEHAAAKLLSEFDKSLCFFTLKKLFFLRNINRGRVCQKAEVHEEPVKPSSSWWRFWRYEEKKVDKKKQDLPDPCQPPSSSKSHVQSLGAHSLSSFGIFGTILEVLVIFYISAASVVGVYHLPGFRMLRPEIQETSMTKIILNCLLMQLLSSSLPVLSRLLGTCVRFSCVFLLFFFWCCLVFMLETT